MLFVNSTQIEQQHQVDNYLPTVEEYMSRRIGSSAVRVCLALTEFSQNIRISPSVMEDLNMQVVWDSTNIIISLVNDILSIKKEFAQGQVDTILPLLFHRHGDIEKAMAVATSMIVESVEALDHAAEVLLSEHSADESVLEVLEIFVDVCKFACTGNLSWRYLMSLSTQSVQANCSSLVSGRFGLVKKSTRGGITFEL